MFYVKQKIFVVQDIILPPGFEVGESLLGCFDSEESDFFCANYVDDTMFPMCHNTYSLLLSKMIVMASIIFDVFASFLLKLSFYLIKLLLCLASTTSAQKTRWVAVILTIFGSFPFIVKLTVLYSVGS